MGDDGVTVYTALLRGAEDEIGESVLCMALHPLDDLRYGCDRPLPYRMCWTYEDIRYIGGWHSSMRCGRPRRHFPDDEAALRWLLDGERADGGSDG